jgi:NitT/TauT family transport system substrate-binding protein
MIHLVHRCRLAGLACTVAVLAAGTCGTGAQTPVRFTLDWRFEGPAAPFTVALDNGY